jgi:cytochrome c-type biogenesis protein
MGILLSFDRSAPGLLLAFLAGGVNSLSPCCLAMTPAFVAHLAGVEAEAATRRQVISHALLYVVGFSLVFVAIGAGVSLAGVALGDERPILWKVGGSVVIAFGLVQLGLLRVPWLQRSFSAPTPSGLAAGYGRSFVVGATYSLAWTPCIGPALGAILTSALVFGDFWQGVALLSAFALGMAIPHLGTALAVSRVAALRRFVHRHALAVERASGTAMVVMGVLIFTGTLIEIFRYFQAFNVVL